jgi:hypothetical protein
LNPHTFVSIETLYHYKLEGTETLLNSQENSVSGSTAVFKKNARDGLGDMPKILLLVAYVAAYVFLSAFRVSRIFSRICILSAFRDNTRVSRICIFSGGF